MAKKEAKAGGATKKPTAARTGRPPSAAYVRIPIQLPVPYLDVLDQESGRYQQGRGEFLKMLVQRRAGTLQITRPADAPQYRVKEKDLATKAVYAWYVTPRVREQVDALRLRLGNLGLREFFITMINEWLDRPHGLDLEK